MQHLHVLTAVVVAVLVATAPRTRLFKLTPALLCLTAVAPMTPFCLAKARFGFSDALLALVVTVTGLQRRETASQQESADDSRDQLFA